MWAQLRAFSLWHGCSKVLKVSTVRTLYRSEVPTTLPHAIPKQASIYKVNMLVSEILTHVHKNYLIQ